MPNAIQLANGPLPQAANTTLTATIPSSGAATPTVASAANLPTKGPFLVVVDNERIEVDSISGSTLTILSGGRAKEGTSAAAHSSGASVYQVLSAATAVRMVEDRTGTVLAPDPTGVAATDKANLDALTGTAGTTVQLRPGVYVCNPLATTAADVTIRGWPGLQSTLKLAVQTDWNLLGLGARAVLEGVVVDGDRANQTSTWDEWRGTVEMATGAAVRRCKFQNGKSSFVQAAGGQQLDNPALLTCTTNTSGGSLANATAFWYRITVTNATGETQPSNELTVTTGGSGGAHRNTITWRKVAGATGYKVYVASGAAGQWNEALLATLGDVATYSHTTGTGSGAIPMTNTTAASVNDIEITDNIFTNSAKGAIFVEYNVNRVLIARNRFTLIQLRAIRVTGSQVGNYGLSDQPTIESNFCDYSGVTISSAEGATPVIEVWNGVPHATIANNHIIGPRDNDDASSESFIPISLGGNTDHATVTGNTIRKANPNGRNDAITWGIEIAGSSNCTVTGNTIEGAYVGITCAGADFESGGPDQSAIVGNTIRGCHLYGIMVTEGSGHTIAGNTLIDCGQRYIFLNGFQKATLACSVTGNTFFIASNDQSAADGGSMKAIYIVNSGRQTISGNICGPLPTIAVPAAPTVAPQGTTGATTYTYKVTAVSEYGETTGSANGSTATGNATLTGANFNLITWTGIPGATRYRVYRTVGGATQGLLGEAAGGAPEFEDTGIAAQTTITAPVVNTTGGTSTTGLVGLYFQGTAVVEACIINGNRFDGSPPLGSTFPNDAITFDDQVDYTQLVNNFAQNYARSFLYTVGTASANPNFIQFNVAPGIPLPHVQGNGPKFNDIVRRSDEVQRLGGGVYLCDDFTGGLATTGNIGDLGWQFLNGTAISHRNAEASHSGIVRMDTSGTTATRQYFWVGSTATIGQVLPADWWHMIVMLRMNTTDANTLMRVGLGNSANADPPADGCYIEKLAADTQWFGVTRASSSQGRTAALATVTAAAWVKLCVRRVSSSAIGFSVSTSFNPDNGTEATRTANIPTTALVPFLMIGNSAAASKTADIDYVELNVQNMTR